MRLGFVGGGVMARAVVQGVLQSSSAAEVTAVAVYDPDPNALRAAVALAGGAGAGAGAGARAGAGAGATPVRAATSNADVTDSSDVVWLCTKPQYLAAACGEIRGRLSRVRVVVSIAAGTTCATIERALGSTPATPVRVVRVMPNTPATLGVGASAVCGGTHATEEDVALVRRLLEPLGAVVAVANEDLMHGVTGLSGSGPAYVFLAVEALADGGVREGLPRDVALKLAAQTVKGAAEMVLRTGTHPGALKDQVASPGGTTIAGLAALERRAVRSAFIEAVTAAANRSRELSKL